MKLHRQRQGGVLGGGSPDRAGPSQRCSTSGVVSEVVTTEENVATRDTNQHSVSPGGIWAGWGVQSAVSLPRHAARVLNKR